MEKSQPCIRQLHQLRRMIQRCRKECLLLLSGAFPLLVAVAGSAKPGCAFASVAIASDRYLALRCTPHAAGVGALVAVHGLYLALPQLRPDCLP